MEEALRQAKELMEEIQSKAKSGPVKQLTPQPNPIITSDVQGYVVHLLIPRLDLDVPRLRIQCDVNGCTIVPIVDEETQRFPGIRFLFSWTLRMD